MFLARCDSSRVDSVMSGGPLFPSIKSGMRIEATAEEAKRRRRRRRRRRREDFASWRKQEKVDQGIFMAALFAILILYQLFLHEVE